MKPFLKGQKNDFRDAEAVAEAVQQDVVTLILSLVAVYAAICAAAYGNACSCTDVRPSRAGGGWPKWRQRRFFVANVTACLQAIVRNLLSSWS